MGDAPIRSRAETGTACAAAKAATAAHAKEILFPAMDIHPSILRMLGACTFFSGA